MMKKSLTKTLLVAATLLLGGTNFAWGEGEIAFESGNKIGAIDNSTGWYGQASEIFTIAYNQTLTLKFKTYTATDEQLGETTWGSHMTHVLNFWDGNYQNLFVRGDGYGWKANQDGHADSGDPTNFNTNDPTSSSTYTYNDTNFGSNYRTIIGEGADVVLKIARYGKELRITEDITTSAGVTYRHYFVGKFGTSATASIWCQMTVEHAHIDISENKALATSVADTPVTGTLIGTLNNGLGGIKVNPYQSFTLAENGSLSLHFKNYTNKVQNWNNWVLELTPDNSNYLDLRADNYGWGTYWNGSNCSISNYDWNTFKDDMNGADVVMNITRSSSSIAITATMTSTASKVFSETYNVTHDDFSSGDITVNLCCEGGHLDLLPVTAAISSYGWATFSSDYALDFSKATKGLEAYMITGQDGVVVTKDLVTGTVPARTGLLLKGAAGDYNIPIVGSSSTDVSANLMVAGTGASVSAEEGKTRYVLGVNNNSTPGDVSDDFAEFQKIVETAATVAKGKAYLEFVGESLARSMRFEGDDITGVENIEAIAEATLKEGKFIENGKLVIVKNGMKFNAAGQQMK